jgi:hypothetical protein
MKNQRARFENGLPVSRAFVMPECRALAGVRHDFGASRAAALNHCEHHCQFSRTFDRPAIANWHKTLISLYRSVELFSKLGIAQRVSYAVSHE